MQSELLAEYNELTTTIRALREQAKEKAKIILQQGMASYFEKHGNLVRCITWRQYTPYFNDGESCEFSVHEPVAIMWPVIETEDEEDDDYSEDSKHAYYTADFDVQGLVERVELMTAYEADPIAWSKACVSERNSAMIGSYRYPDNYYVTYPPDQYSVEELELMVTRAEQVTEDFKRDTEAVLGFINSMDESIMEELFGDHVQVIINANDTIVEDYNHD
jgi:hypothetical protein